MALRVDLDHPRLPCAAKRAQQQRCQQEGRQVVDLEDQFVAVRRHLPPGTVQPRAVDEHIQPVPSCADQRCCLPDILKPGKIGGYKMYLCSIGFLQHRLHCLRLLRVAANQHQLGPALCQALGRFQPHA